LGAGAADRERVEVALGVELRREQRRRDVPALRGARERGRERGGNEGGQAAAALAVGVDDR
jgi:hypothetical protein